MPRSAGWSFAPPLLLASAALFGACGVRTELLDPGLVASAPTGDANDEVSPPPADALGDEEADVVEPPQLGTCSFGDQSLLCLPGNVCHANFVVGPSPFICGPSGDPAAPCGLIGCGEGCACVDATNSVCGCN